MSISRAEAVHPPNLEHKTTLDRARSLDPQVWTAWHDEYSGFIYRYAYARLSSEDEARDITSQTFLEALRSIHRYSDRGKPVLAWLYGIAHHLVSRRRRELARVAPAAELPLEADASPASEDQIVLGVDVRQALERMKPEQRDVLIMRFAMDLPTKEVARIIGKTEAATYSLQVRASATLKKLLSA